MVKVMVYVFSSCRVVNVIILISHVKKIVIAVWTLIYWESKSNPKVGYWKQNFQISFKIFACFCYLHYVTGFITVVEWLFFFHFGLEMPRSLEDLSTMARSNIHYYDSIGWYIWNQFSMNQFSFSYSASLCFASFCLSNFFLEFKNSSDRTSKVS